MCLPASVLLFLSGHTGLAEISRLVSEFLVWGVQARRAQNWDSEVCNKDPSSKKPASDSAVRADPHSSGAIRRKLNHHRGGAPSVAAGQRPGSWGRATEFRRWSSAAPSPYCFQAPSHRRPPPRGPVRLRAAPEGNSRSPWPNSASSARRFWRGGQSEGPLVSAGRPSGQG